ncbi:hypothetical protein DFJ74DRAFT_668250 [Hyaloraphidium curvatum]|nr:hypothetical protein DFJ74DRAFT_668250 [Hyaloraphidium curvatum]
MTSPPRSPMSGPRPATTGGATSSDGAQRVYLHGIGFEASPLLVASALMSGARFATQEDLGATPPSPDGVLLEPLAAVDDSRVTLDGAETSVGPSESRVAGQDSVSHAVFPPPASAGPSQSRVAGQDSAFPQSTSLSSLALRQRSGKLRIFIDEGTNDLFEQHIGPLVPDVNYSLTFSMFQIRQLERERTGTYRRSSSFKVFTSALLVLMGTSVLVYWAISGVQLTGVFGVLLVITYVPISIALIWVVSIRFRGIALLILATMIVFVALSLFYQQPGNETYNRAIFLLAITFGVLLGIIALFYLLFYIVWPRLLLSDLKNFQISVTDTWKIRPALDKGSPNGFFEFRTYEGHWSLKRSKRYFSYRGEVNADNQPHGLGEWSDDSYTGECLRGYFENGKPIGPFISREFGTSNQFAAVRLAIWRNVEDPWNQNSTFNPSRNKRGPQWGSVRGECSVGGDFFACFPLAEQLIPPTHEEDDPDIVSKVFENVSRGLPPVPPGVRKEALIILHGMNSPLEYACGTYSQLMTLAKFPTHVIVPVMFSWPGGTLFNFHAARRNAEDPAWREDFSRFIATLREQGFEIFHIMSHSMGARLVINIAECFPEVFEPVGDDGEHVDFKTSNFTDARLMKRSASSTSSFLEAAFAPHPDYAMDPGGTKHRSHDAPHVQRKPRLMTMTFLNAEADIERFRTMFPIMRSVCPIITAYGDADDWALLFSEILNGGQKMLGKELETLYVEPEDYMRLEAFFSSYSRQDVPDEDIGSFANGAFEDAEDGDSPPPEAADAEIVEMEEPPHEEDLNRGGTFERSVAGRKMSAPSTDGRRTIGRVQTYLRRQRRKYYDMDVISTEFLQTNVQALRHVYFQFNRQFMDDLRETIVDKRRARYRKNLALRAGNCYSFLNVPPFVTV